jgi:hypothetical protein
MEGDRAVNWNALNAQVVSNARSFSEGVNVSRSVR